MKKQICMKETAISVICFFTDGRNAELFETINGKKRIN
jgi:hypothetical protein